MQSLPLYMLLAMSFVLLRLHLLPGRSTLRQIASQHGTAEGLRPQSGRQHSRSSGAVRHEPVLATADHLVRCRGGVLLVLCCHGTVVQSIGIASFCFLLAILSWPVQPEIQRLYSPYQLLVRMAKAPMA